MYSTGLVGTVLVDHIDIAVRLDRADRVDIAFYSEIGCSLDNYRVVRDFAKLIL
jgi:hypothetical protein